MLRSTQQRGGMNAQQAQRHLELARQTQEGLRQEALPLVSGRSDGLRNFMMDLNGHIISWNTGAERILGYQE